MPNGLRPATLLLATACAAPKADVLPPAAAGPPGPPNVLLVIADDQGWADLGCAGLADDVATPSLDRLARSGLRFTRAYATSPICNASRAGLLTGSYQQRFGTFWYGGEGIHDERFVTLPELLRDAGYATGLVGKFHFGKHAVHVPGNRNFPLEHGYDEFYGFSAGRKHYLVHRAAAEAEFQAAKREHGRRTGQSLRRDPMWIGDEQVDQEGFSTELFGERARDFVRRHKEGPFFLTVAFNAVHNFTHQLPPEYLEEHGLEGYPDWDPAAGEYYDWYRAGRRPHNPEGRAHYLGQLHYLDREVGKILDCLEEEGLAERTLVVYIGDNGGSTPIYASNGPLRGSKYTLYEGGIRVPLLIAWPGVVEAGRVREEVVSALDLLPTIALAAGVDAPPHADGRDLGLVSANTTPRGPLVWDTGHETAVRLGDWKWKTATSDRHAEYEMVEVEVGEFLYDLESDPGESTDVKEAHPEIAAELRAIHAAWRASLDD